MIEIVKLQKSFRNLKVLDEISFSVAKGQVTGIVGPNGCGKTTLIKSILGLVIPDSGEIKIQNKSIQDGWSYRNDIGYMPQNPEFPGNLTIQELFDLLEDVRGRKATLRKYLSELFELQSHQGKVFSVLSGGTKQKVAAVAAFMFEPALLILDEPTVGLDPISSLRFKELVREFSKKGSSVLLVSHIMSEMEQLVDQMIFILDGKVSFSGDTREILKASKTATNLEMAIVEMIEGRI